ncbi:MAG: restriction endonuclease [Firmicutes bacterium]|nr:restriction endonuclease [Bacillota bacterium]
MGTGGYPWARYGLVVELTARMQDASRQFGKTAMQKMIYLLQAVYGVNLGYDFSFYTYGPYSFDLSRDLKIIEYHGGVEINFINSGTWGYSIKPGDKSPRFRGKAANTIHQNSSKLDSVIKEFGKYSAKELELRSTIIYVYRDAKENGQQQSRDDFIGVVYNLKPNFGLGHIDNVITCLEKKGFITMCP